MKQAEKRILGKNIPTPLTSLTNFKMYYANRVFEPVAETIYDFISAEYAINDAYCYLSDEYMEILGKVGELTTLVSYINEVRYSGRLTNYYETLSDSVRRKIICSLNNILFDAIDDLWSTVDNNHFWDELEPPLAPIIGRWETIVNEIPCREDCVIEKDGYIDDDEFFGIRQAVSAVFDSIEDSYIRSKNDFADAFIRFVIGLKLPLSNRLYRDIYDCMKMLNVLDSEQIRLHESSTSKYVRENYIKLKIKRMTDK